MSIAADPSQVTLLEASHQSTKNVREELDPPPEKSQGMAKAIKAVTTGVLLGSIFAFPFIETHQIRPHASWGYDGVQDFYFNRFFGLVMIFNFVLPSFYTQFVLAFGKAGKGRSKHGYPLPQMFPAIDIHILDVASDGAILSQGNPEKAKQLLENASSYAKHQRVHYNALESIPLFFVLSFVSGFRNPLTVAFHGLIWLVARVTWTNGYLNGAPISRYKNPLAIGVWSSLLGVLFCALVNAIELLSA